MSSSGMGLVVLAIIGFVALGVLIGAILLIRWAWKSNGSPAAQAGAYLGAGCLLLGLVGCPAVMFPVFLQAKEAAKRTICIANLTQISRAMQMYASDNSDRLPLKSWCDPLLDYVSDHTVFACPLLEEPYGYTFNAALAGKEIAAIPSPAAVPLVFDGPGGKDSVGDSSIAQFRHLDEACAAYFSAETRRHKRGTLPVN